MILASKSKCGKILVFNAGVLPCINLRFLFIRVFFEIVKIKTRFKRDVFLVFTRQLAYLNFWQSVQLFIESKFPVGTEAAVFMGQIIGLLFKCLPTWTAPCQVFMIFTTQQMWISILSSDVS